MGGDLVRRDISSKKETKKNANVWHILYDGGFDRFMNTCRDEDEQMSLEVVEYWNEGVCNVNGLELVFST